jgi:hypothetical protein
MAPQNAAESELGGQPSGIKLPWLPLRELGLKYVPADHRLDGAAANS